jgi:hypothetical protein
MPKSAPQLPELQQILREKNLESYYALRLATPEKQPLLFALFIIFFEAYEACTMSREPMLGKIKIAWWRERLQELDARKQSRPHPAILALSDSFSEHKKILDILDEFEKLLDGWQPKTHTEISVFISKTFGELFNICGEICGATDAESLGVAYGNLYLLRKLKNNKANFLSDEKIAESAIENFSKNLENISQPKAKFAQKSGFYIIINHYKKHENSKRGRLLLKLFFQAHSAF